MSELGDTIFVRGKPERIIEKEMILRDGQPFYMALRTEPVKQEPVDADQPGAL